MKSLKAALSLIMVLAVSLCSYAPIYAVPVTDTIITVSVMSDELIDKLNSVNDTDIVDVIVWITDVDDDAVAAEVKQKTGLTENTVNDSLGIETVKNYVSEKRSVYTQKYNTSNTAFINTAKNDCETLDVIFQSSLSPMMIVSANKQDIRKLSMNINVVSMDLYDNFTFSSNSVTANKNSFAEYMRDTVGATGTYTANGSTKKIKIGQIEPATPNFSGYAAYFDTANCHSYGTSSTDSSDIRHATLVAAIMVGKAVTYGGKTYEGIVPDAELYSYAASDSDTIFDAVEFLVKSETDGGCGVEIINASLGANRSGRYDFVSQWIDHIAFKHDVHFVAAAGNTNVSPDGYVTSPAMAYNAITVGNYENKNSLRQSWIIESANPGSLDSQTLSDKYFRMADTSCFRTASGYSKPDLIAEGTDIEYGAIVVNSGYKNSGTSFAAPQVAGIIAQLCSKYPSLLTKQSTVKAILAASAVYRVDWDEENDEGKRDGEDKQDGQLAGSYLLNKQGAGVANAAAAYAVLLGGKYMDITLPNTTHYYTVTITVPSSYSYLRVAMSWIKKNTAASGSCSLGTSASYQQLANLKLEVFKGTDPTGETVYTSDLDDSNLELVQFHVNGGGTYTIVITNKSYNSTAITGSQYISLAWY